MRYFLEKRITTYMVFAGLFLFGVIGLSKLPISLMPYTGYPGISIIIEYPGISPEKIETIITKPVEKIVKTVPGIEKIDSVSEDGKARINVNFQMDADVKIAALKVREKIGLIRGSFPRAVQEPVVIRYDPSDKPIIIATIARKGVSLEEMREIAERKVKPQLQRIEGISEINIAGGRQREIHIDLNQGRFEGRSLSFEKLFTTVQSGNVSLPGGLLAYGKREYVVYTPSRFKSIGEIADTAVLQTAQGSLVRLGDIGQVLDSYRDQEDIARLDGKENVTIYIQKAGDANILELCNSIVRLFSKLTEYEINVVYNQGRYIRAAITNVVSSCIWGVLIVIMVIYIFFRKLDYVITIGLTIPYTIVVVFACMYFAGVNIDIMSLSGVALGGGMIVDTSIIVTESIFSSRRINTETILGGIGYVRNAVVSSTVTTVIVFLPLVFGDILTQRMYGGMAFTITLALLVSLVVALLLVPAVYQELAIRAPRSKSSISRRSAVFDRLRPLLDAFFAQADSFERTMHQKYEKALGYVFGHPRTVLGVVAVMLAIATGSLFFIKSEFIDPMGTGEFYVYIEFPTGSTLEFANEASRKAEDHVKGLKVTEKISTKVEKMRATLSITLLEEVSSTKKRERIKARIRQDLNNLMTPYGGFAFLSEADEAASREFTITFLGDENETLRSIAKTAAGKIGAIKGIEECVLRFREGRPSYCLYLDREKANLSMLSARDVAGFFHNAVFGPVVTKFVAEDREVDVRVRYLKEQRDTLDKLMGYSIVNSKGMLVPVREIVKVKEEVEPTKIWRTNGRRCVSITAKIGRLSYEEAADRITAVMRDVSLPPEYAFEFDENIEKIRKSRSEMLVLILLAVLFVYMVLAVLFESLSIPLVIMVSVPLAVIGVLIVLFLTGSSLNMSVYIGLIILAGTAVNNGCVLVDAMTINLRSAGSRSDRIAVIKETCLKHFRPVMATTITAIMGLIPALLNTGEGSNLWRPLSLTVITGLSTSTALTLLVVPLMFNWMSRTIGLKTKITKKK